MATLEVEDLAALVGIEIVSDGAGKAVIEGSEQQSAQEPDQSTASQPGIEEHGGREAATELLRFDYVCYVSMHGRHRRYNVLPCLIEFKVVLLNCLKLSR